MVSSFLLSWNTIFPLPRDKDCLTSGIRITLGGCKMSKFVSLTHKNCGSVDLGFRPDDSDHLAWRTQFKKHYTKELTLIV